MALYATRDHLARADRAGRDVPTGFVHLPLTPDGAASKARDGDAVRG